VQMFHNQRGVSILSTIETIGLDPRDLSDDRHPHSLAIVARSRNSCLNVKNRPCDC